MRYLTIVFSLICCALGAAAQSGGHYAVQLRDFTELKVTDGINVDYVCSADSAGYAVFDAGPEVANKILFEPSGSKLTIQVSAEEGAVKNLPTVRVYSRYLSSVENGGDSLVRVLSVAPGPKFKAKLIGNGRLSIRQLDMTEVNASITSGNGTLTVNGRCDVAILSLVGTGTITADGLEANEAKVRLTGTGTVGCAPRTKLQVRGAGSGRVLYTGNPEISKFAPGIKVERL